MADTQDKTELAEERTDWSEDRTALAMERTFAGWMRTGMASVALALGLKALFRPFEPTWLPKLVATAFILVAILVFWTARQAICRAAGRIETHEAVRLHPSRATLIASALSVSAAAAGAILWWL